MRASYILMIALGSALAGCSSDGSGTADCDGDNCVCPASENCEHECSPGGIACNVQGHPGRDTDIQCAAGERCNVECSNSSACAVDCGGSTACNVTCPAAGCMVTSCDAACNVTCGLGSTLPTKSGTTATCP